MTRIDNARTIRAPRGTELSAKSWLTEAPLRMLMNNLDPEVAEKPSELVVYGGIGRAARDWESFDRIVAALRKLEADETLLVQSGKPVGVFRTHTDAPRVLIANSNLVPHWATLEHFNELDRKGLMMYGQMTAGSWIYIGSQGIVQGTYETFVEVGRRHYGGSLAGKWILTAGLGGMGGAQPLAAVMAGASMLAVECQPSRIEMRLQDRVSRRAGQDPRRGAAHDRALVRREEAAVRRPARQCCRHFPGAGAARRAPGRGDRPDVRARSHQRLPAQGLVVGAVGKRAPSAIPTTSRRPPSAPWPSTCAPCWSSTSAAFQRSTTATTSARWPWTRAWQTRSTSRASCRPISARCSAAASARSAGRRCRATPRTSGRPTPRSRSCCRTTRICTTGSTWRKERIKFQGLPARICWVGLGDRHRLGLAFNEMVASGELKAPIVIGRDHLDSGSVASPNRETEAMRDGSDAVSDWPLLNALLNCASGATWVSIHHGGGVGIGYSQHAGMVIVCDGTPDAARRIERVLWNDPATGVMRHADAGYEDAITCARQCGLHLPGLA